MPDSEKAIETDFMLLDFEHNHHYSYQVCQTYRQQRVSAYLPATCICTFADDVLDVHTAPNVQPSQYMCGGQ